MTFVNDLIIIYSVFALGNPGSYTPIRHIGIIVGIQISSINERKEIKYMGNIGNNYFCVLLL